MKLRVQAGVNAGQEFEITQPVTTIGRAPDNTIVLPDPTVSRHHARVDRQGNAFILSDLGSTSGTWLNGARLTAPQWLREGDILTLGRTTLVALPSVSAPVFLSPPPVPVSPLPASPAASPARSPMMVVVALIGTLGVILLGLAVVLFLRGGGANLAMAQPTVTVLAPTPVPVPSDTPVPTVTLIPTATPTPTQTPLPTNTPTPTLTPTPTASPTATPLPRRLSNGTFIKEAVPRDGQGDLEIDNGQDLDAVAVMTTLADAPIFSVYVQARSKFKVEGIRDGTYKLFFMLGEDWDSATGRFTRKVHYEVFEDTLRYTTTSTTATIWRVTFHSVFGGTARTNDVDPSRFPPIK
jgi:pSer/pThr/pTyr-binding forkhead associated (FHA) protein